MRHGAVVVARAEKKAGRFDLAWWHLALLTFAARAAAPMGVLSHQVHIDN